MEYHQPKRSSEPLNPPKCGSSVVPPPPIRVNFSDEDVVNKLLRDIENNSHGLRDRLRKDLGIV